MNLLLCFVRHTLFAFLFFLPFIADNAFCDQKAVIKTGDLFPQNTLNLPADANDAAYLGILRGKPFSVSDIKADLVLVEIMNINCGSCQRQAPIYNKLYELVEKTPETRGRIKILAIGAGSSDKSIRDYRDYFKAPYPIVEDLELEVYNAIGRGPVPLAIYVRPRLEGKAGVVAGTHEGVNEDPEGMFREMRAYMEMDLAAIMETGAEEEAYMVAVEPVLTEEELASVIKDAFQEEGSLKYEMSTIDLKRYGTVYTAVVRTKGGSTRLFAKVVSRPPPCDECHDTHFIYIFDKSGSIRRFIPLQLTKYGNEDWDHRDIDQMKGQIVGQSIEAPFDFDEGVDAVSSATITSLVIYHSLNEGKDVFRALKKEGWIK